MDQAILQQLKDKIRGVPCNALGRIYPDEFATWFNISGERISNFIIEMIRCNLLICKYNFECECMNNCTAYENTLKRSQYVCVECGREYDINYIREHGELVYELEKEEVLEFQIEQVNYKELVRNASDNIISFEQEKEGMKVANTIVNNNIVFNGPVSDSPIQQGNENSQQQIKYNATPDYNELLQGLLKIEKFASNSCFDEEFGQDSERVRGLIKDAIEDTKKKEESSKIKEHLEKIKLIAGSIVQGVVVTGVKTLVESIIASL